MNKWAIIILVIALQGSLLANPAGSPISVALRENISAIAEAVSRNIDNDSMFAKNSQDVAYLCMRW